MLLLGASSQPRKAAGDDNGNDNDGDDDSDDDDGDDNNDDAWMWVPCYNTCDYNY